jgi:hypothetical protein
LPELVTSIVVATKRNIDIHSKKKYIFAKKSGKYVSD